MRTCSARTRTAADQLTIHHSHWYSPQDQYWQLSPVSVSHTPRRTKPTTVSTSANWLLTFFLTHRCFCCGWVWTQPSEGSPGRPNPSLVTVSLRKVAHCYSSLTWLKFRLLLEWMSDWNCHDFKKSETRIDTRINRFHIKLLRYSTIKDRLLNKNHPLFWRG